MTNTETTETTYVATAIARLDAEAVDRALAALRRIEDLCPEILEGVCADRALPPAERSPVPGWAEQLGELRAVAIGARVHLDLAVDRRVDAARRAG